MGRAEAKVEYHFTDICENAGAMVRKVVYQGRKGSPDRWAFFPDGGLLIAELKKKGEEPSEQQRLEMQRLRDRGQWVAWLDSIELADKLLTDFLTLDRISFNGQWPIY